MTAAPSVPKTTTTKTGDNSIARVLMLTLAAAISPLSTVNAETNSSIPIELLYVFEQGFDRQTNENRSLPVLANASHGNICIVGLKPENLTTVNSFIRFFQMMTNQEIRLSPSDDISLCPAEVRKVVNITSTSTAKTAIDSAHFMAARGVDMGSAYIPNPPESGVITLFTLKDHRDLYAISAVSKVDDPKVQNAILLRSLFQITTVSQPAEWSGNFFSIIQRVEQHNHQSVSRILPGQLIEHPEALVDQNLNAIGLCWTDAVIIHFLFNKSGPLSFEDAIGDIAQSGPELIEFYRASRVWKKFPEIFDARCEEPPK